MILKYLKDFFFKKPEPTSWWTCPDCNAYMPSSLADNHKKHHAAYSAPPPKPKEYIWPECAPVPPGQHWQTVHNYVFRDGFYYKPTDMGDGTWNMTIDQAYTDAMEANAKEEQDRKDLLFACQTRVLTDEELKKVELYGVFILGSSEFCSKMSNRIIRDHSRQMEFQNLLYNQAKLKILSLTGKE